jgi:hypothetical protein
MRLERVFSIRSFFFFPGQSTTPSQNLSIGRHVALSLHINWLLRQETTPWHILGSSSEVSSTPTPMRSAVEVEPQSGSLSQIQLNKEEGNNFSHAIYMVLG